VGGPVGPTEILVPRELLQRRSRKFRNSLEQQTGELSSKVIQLPDTPVQTVEDFFWWTCLPQPKIDERATFSEVVQLGIFASLYQISALSNQATDVIRSNLAKGDWQLQASMVDDIYKAVPTGGPLREVIRGALGRLPRPSVEGRVREEWRATFLKHAQLGLDYYEVGGSGWTSEEYLSGGACRFHDHPGVSHQEEFENQCAYAREECFPRWEEENMESQKDEVGWKGWIAVAQERNGEQERCGADEERKEGELSIEAVVHEAKEPEATEAIEAVVNDVATEAVVNSVATEAAVNGVATDAVVDGVAPEAVVDDTATETAVSVTTESAPDDPATDPSAVTETGVDGADGPVANWTAVKNAATNPSVATDPSVVTETGVDGSVANGSVVESTATDPSVVTETGVDGADGPVTNGTVVEKTATHPSVATEPSVPAERGVHGGEGPMAIWAATGKPATDPSVATEPSVAAETGVDGGEGPVANGKTGGKRRQKKKKGNK
jgi:hypothetical protein